MDRKKKASVTIIDRNYPPSPGITGEAACDLADFLEMKGGIEINIVHIDTVYDGGGRIRRPVGNVFKVRSFYNGKNKLLRLIGSIIEGYFLIKKSLRISDGLVICMTNPPLLTFWASLFLKKEKRVWFLWSMDLYPQAFVANRLINENNFIYKFLKRISYSYIPNQLIFLGPKQKEYIEQIYGKSIPGVMLPCGVFSSVPPKNSNSVPSWVNRNKIIFGYCGNLGEAHSSDFLLSFIDKINPELHLLVLSVYGSKSDEVNRLARSKPGVLFLSHVPREMLSYIDVHLVSLLKEWNHICVPSKAVSAICSGATILFYGSKESDNWCLLEKAGWLISEGDDLPDQIDYVLKQITLQSLSEKKKQAFKIASELNEQISQSYDKIYNIIMDSY